jgi:hypothetical protein
MSISITTADQAEKEVAVIIVVLKHDSAVL